MFIGGYSSYPCCCYSRCDVVRELVTSYGVDPASTGVVIMNTVCYNSCYCVVQDGLQPIHVAAQYGHEDAVSMFVEEFHIRPDVGGTVSIVCVCAGESREREKRTPIFLLLTHAGWCGSASLFSLLSWT